MMKIMVNIIGRIALIWTLSCSGIICSRKVLAFSMRIGSRFILPSFIIFRTWDCRWPMWACSIGSAKKFLRTVFIVIEKVPRMRTVRTKNSVSGRIGASTGSAMFPRALRMFGLMMRKVIKIMTSNMVIIEPFGGGGGGAERFAMIVLTGMRVMKVGLPLDSNGSMFCSHTCAEKNLLM